MLKRGFGVVSIVTKFIKSKTEGNMNTNIKVSNLCQLQRGKWDAITNLR